MQNQTGGVISPQLQQGISQTVSPHQNLQTGYNEMFYQLEQGIGADFQKLKELVGQGAISQEQGQYLLTQLAKKAQQINKYKTALNSGIVAPEQFGAAPTPMQSLSPMEVFNQERPGFFDGEARTDVLNYIKGLDMDKDEIHRISQLVEKLENSAVDKYLKKSAYEKTLNDENAAAKSRLTAYAQNTSSDGNLNRIFTREQIGDMSGEEFDQNEKAIMEQLKQGLIR